MSWWSPSLETPKQQINGDVMEFIRNTNEVKRLRLDSDSIKTLPQTPKLATKRSESGSEDEETSSFPQNDINAESNGNNQEDHEIFKPVSSSDLDLFLVTPKIRRPLRPNFNLNTVDESPIVNLDRKRLYTHNSRNSFESNAESQSTGIGMEFSERIGIDSPGASLENYFNPRNSAMDNLDKTPHGFSKVAQNSPIVCQSQDLGIIN